MSKPNLILIPGLVCNAKLWRHQIEALEDTHNIVVVNHDHAEGLVSLAQSVLDLVDGDFSIAGHSMGGYVTFEVWRQAVRMMEDQRITRMALLGTQARTDDAAMEKSRRDFIKLARRGKFKGMSPVLLQNFLAPDSLKNKEVTSLVYEMAEETGPDGFINQAEIILERPDSRATLLEITCPTMVLVGDKDQRTPPELAEEMARCIPKAELVTVDNCGHLPMIEQPEAVTRAMKDWLGVI